MKTLARQSAISMVLGGAIALGMPLAQAESMEETTITEKSTGAAMPVVSERGRETRAITVSYADIRLESQAGLNTLYARIEGAAKTVCGPDARKYGRDLSQHRDWQGCLDNAVDGAVADINHTGLNEYHLAQTGRWVGDNERVADR